MRDSDFPSSPPIQSESGLRVETIPARRARPDGGKMERQRLSVAVAITHVGQSQSRDGPEKRVGSQEMLDLLRGLGGLAFDGFVRVECVVRREDDIGAVG